mmetsp:Transcript_3113/g.6270  ORF Transcript_3113/g.6270 Transcript_3113/m.6270 type:complete len:113 (-) Transcript_3113:18-356(-)
MLNSVHVSVQLGVLLVPNASLSSNLLLQLFVLLHLRGIRIQDFLGERRRVGDNVDDGSSISGIDRLFSKRATVEENKSCRCMVVCSLLSLMCVNIMSEVMANVEDLLIEETV